MHRWLRLFALVAAGAAVLAAPLSAQKQGQLFLSLTGPDGRPVEGLTAADVNITEDGAECKTLKLEPINWPTKVQVLIDNGRANTTPINPLRDGLKDFFNAMPEGTEVSLYTTAGTPRNVIKPTADKEKLTSGIGLIAPDGGIGMFFDALSEAAERVAKEKTPGFSIIVMIGSDIGGMRALDREFQKLQQTVFEKGVTTHVILTVAGGQAGGTVGGQAELGIGITKLTGGRFENINSSTRLATLLPEYGKLVAESIGRQKSQYRVTYERPGKPNERANINATVRHAGTVGLSLHGNQ
jgi:hypothetical protein